MKKNIYNIKQIRFRKGWIYFLSKSYSSEVLSGLISLS